MTVYFIGAGPGDPELITVKGQRLIASCPVCLYAGSLVPPEVVASAPADACMIDTAPLTLEEIIELIVNAHARGQDVSRVHSGDPSLYGAIHEQIRRLDDLDIDYKVVPGVPAFAAAAAAIGRELTIPDVSQSLVITRTTMKSTAMPDGESLQVMAASRCTMAIHLSARNCLHIQRELIPVHGKDCPVVIAYRVGWSDEEIIHTTLENLRAEIRKAKITRTALILVGQVLGSNDGTDSKLYDPDHRHILRHDKLKSTRKSR